MLKGQFSLVCGVHGSRGRGHRDPHPGNSQNYMEPPSSEYMGEKFSGLILNSGFWGWLSIESQPQNPACFNIWISLSSGFRIFEISPMWICCGYSLESSLPCADPERGPTLDNFLSWWVERASKYHLKWTLARRWWSNIFNFPGMLTNPIALWFSRGRGWLGAPVLPLGPRMSSMRF